MRLQRHAAAKTPPAPGGTVLQRACQCNDHTAAEDKCDACSSQDGLLQRCSARTVEAEWMSDIVEQTSGMSVRPQAERRSGPDFSGIPLASPRGASAFSAPRSGPFIIQPKLVVGHVNDPLEAEADRTADRVMRMPTPAPPQVSRKCGCEKDVLRPKQAGPAIGGGAAPTLVHDVLRRPGRRLDAATRAFFELDSDATSAMYESVLTMLPLSPRSPLARAPTPSEGTLSSGVASSHPPRTRVVA